MTTRHQPDLVRAIGRWSLAGLVINSILGSGVFGLPSVVAGLIGRASLWAVPLAGVAIAIVIACYAEVASQFSETGGTYLYIRAAFGRFTGIQMGWFAMLSRFTAAAAAANLFVVYLGALWPDATLPIPRFVLITVLVWVLAGVNYRGVRAGAQMSDVVVAAKLVPLAIVCCAGAYYLISAHRVIPPPTPPADTGAWLKAMLALVFAYGGFEAALNPMGEAKDPRRDAAFALFVSLATISVLYIVIQWVVVGVLPDPGHSDRPLADAMAIMWGRPGAALIALGAMISVYGYLSANMLTGPRSTFAFAERGDFPLWFATVHPRFRTPHLSIVVFAALVWVLALLGGFAWNVTLSAASRLLYYGLICAAVPMLRKKQPDAAAFRLPAGGLFGILGILICAVFLTAVDFSKSLILAATFGIAALNWLFVRNKSVPEPEATRNSPGLL